MGFMYRIAFFFVGSKFHSFRSLFGSNEYCSTPIFIHEGCDACARASDENMR